jgi:hypothetical protein
MKTTNKITRTVRFLKKLNNKKLNKIQIDNLVNQDLA